MATGTTTAPSDGVHLNVAEGVHMIVDGFVNWFLIEGDDGITVVDAGLPRSWNLLGDALTALGRTHADLRALVLTHAHFDHVGFAERARTELGLPVWAHPDEIPITKHPLLYPFERLPAFYMGRPEVLRIMSRFLASGWLQVKGIGQVQAYADGQELAVPGRPRVVKTPGHTPGHCSLHLPDRGVLIAGDALVTLDPYTARSGPRLVARAATADSRQALASLDRIAATGAQVVLPGHGSAWRQGAEAAARYARKAGSA